MKFPTKKKQKEGILVIRLIRIFVICVALITICKSNFSTGNGKTIPSDLAKKNIFDRSAETINAIKMKDVDKLTAIVHPIKGVRFSPYSFVIPKEDIVFKSVELKSLFSSQKEYVWGTYDGSDEPIKLTFKSYFERFVYDKDFASAEKIGYNETLGRGNTLNNIFEIYPNSIVVEYYFSGFDPKFGGMDWKSLRLVFEKLNEQWYLVGISHDEWTI